MGVMHVFTNRKNKAGLLLFFLLRPWLLSYSQNNNPNFEHFTVREGLPSDQVYNCCRDKDGFLWIATDAGVSRFDGRTFKNYTMGDGLGDNEIHDLYQDKLGRIWFIPFSGRLSYYYEGKIIEQDTRALMEGPAHGTTNHVNLSEDAAGQIYLSKMGSKKIIVLHGLQAKPFVYDLSPCVSEGDGFAILYSDRKGQVFCITAKKQMLLLDDHALRNVTPAGFLQQEAPTQFYINRRLSQHAFFFSGAQGIYQFCNGSSRLLIPAQNIPFKNFSELIQVKCDAFNNIWLNHLDRNTLFYAYDHGVYAAPTAVLSHLFSITTCDNEHNIWLATNEGLYKTTYQKLRDQPTFNINQNLAAQKVIACSIDQDSGLWLGYSNGKVSRVKGNSVTHYDLRLERSANNRVVQIKTDADGDLLLGTDETVVLLRRLKKDVYSQPVYFHDENGHVLKCSSKNILFDANRQAYLTQPFYIFRLNKSNRVVRLGDQCFINDHLSTNNTRIFSCFFDAGGQRFYISSIDGLCVYEQGRLTNLAGQSEGFKVRIKDYVEAGDGTIFMATYNNGLLAMRNKNIVGALPRFNGHAVICRRVLLRHDTLYVATNHGIGVLVFNNGRFTLIKMLNEADGLVSPDVNDLVFLGDRLFAATSHGVSSFHHMLRMAAPAAAPSLVLQNVVVNDSVYAANKVPVLSHKASHIRINFIAPVLDKSQLTLYRYRFSAADAWQVTAANFIEFSRLKPGSYQIMIQAKKYNSAWSAPKLVSFIIEPPFYAQAWFIALVVLAVALLLFIIIRSFMNRRLRNQLHDLQKKQAVEQERSRIAADIHDDIGAELTNIAILSRVLKFTTGPDKEESLKIVSKIEASSSQVITKMNDVIWTLGTNDHSLQSLAAHIRSYAASLNEHSPPSIHLNISHTLSIDLSLDAGFTRHVFLMVKELLQNAIKHAKASNITLHVYFSKSYSLCIDYSDDGIGFDMAEVKRGNGLGNIRRRVLDNKGAINISTAIQKGCDIKIILPLKPGL